MTDLTRLVATVEGFPLDTSPNLIMQAAWVRREQKRAELSALSLSIYTAIGTVLGGGDTSRIVRPYYTQDEWDEMTARAENARQEAAQAAQIAKMMRMSEREKDGRR